MSEWRASESGRKGLNVKQMKHWGLVAGVLFLTAQTSLTQAQTQAQAVKTNSPPSLSEQEKRGEGLFLQRCSLCHLPKIEAPAAKPYRSLGPSLKGMLPKDAESDQETFIRQFIMNGTDRMPGFQYGLSSKEIDDVLAYLKTM